MQHIVTGGEPGTINRLRWRVPNTPKSGQSAYTRVQTSPNKKNIPSSPSKITPIKINSAINTPSHSLSRQSSAFQNKIWGVLFTNVNTSVDELYAVCEDEADEVKCREAVDMFERCRLDFDQLIVRIEDQARFDMNQSRGISWDVRKPVHIPVTTSNPAESPGRIIGSCSSKAHFNTLEVQEISNEALFHTIVDEEISKNSNKKMYDNFNETECINFGNVSPRRPRPLSSDCLTVLSTQTAEPGPSCSPTPNISDAVSLSLHQSAVSSSSSSYPPTSQLPTTILVRSRSASPTMPSSLVGRLQQHQINGTPHHHNRVIRSNSIVSVRSNSSSGVSEVDVKKKSIKQKINKSLVSLSSPPLVKEDKDKWLEEVENELAAEVETAWAEAEALVDLEIAAEDHEWRMLSIIDEGISSGANSPHEGRFSRNSSRSSLFSGNTPSPRKPMPRYKYLHEKLSTPPNPWKNLSESEAREKHMARQQQAEQNRGKSEADRRHKLQLMSTRAKHRANERARDKQLAEEHWENKLRDGELRHAEYIKSRRDKAGNELLKVSEIQFINTLNEEDLKDQLQNKMADIEIRVKAAASRRQQYLENISGKNRKASNHKSQQMSALRLRIETEREDRWNRLKTRIEAVQQRKDKRMRELNRRARTIGEEEGIPAVDIITLDSIGEAGEWREGGDLGTTVFAGKRKKGKRKKTYEAQMKHALSEARKGKYHSDGSGDRGIHVFIAPAVKVVGALLQKKTVAERRKGIVIKGCNLNLESNEEVRRWTSILIQAFSALKAKSSEVADARHAFDIYALYLETVVRSRLNLDFILNGGLLPIAYILEKMTESADASPYILKSKLWHTLWGVLNSASTLPMEATVSAQSKSTMFDIISVQLGSATVIDTLNTTLTCWTLYAASEFIEEKQSPGSYSSLIGMLDPVVVYVTRLLDTYMSKGSDSDAEELHAVISYIFASGIIGSLAQATDHLITLVRDVLCTSDGKVCMELAEVLSRLLLSIICGLRHRAPCMGMKSYDESPSLANPNGNEWLNRLSSSGLAVNLFSAVQLVDLNLVGSHSMLLALTMTLSAMGSANIGLLRPLASAVAISKLIELSLQVYDQGGTGHSNNDLFHELLQLLGVILLLLQPNSSVGADYGPISPLIDLLVGLPVKYFIDVPCMDVIFPVLIALILHDNLAVASINRQLHMSYITTYLKALQSGLGSTRVNEISRRLPISVWNIVSSTLKISDEVG